MASSHSPPSPTPPSSAEDSLVEEPEVVWGAPSNEMLAAEQRGEIILVEDISRTVDSADDRSPHDRD